MIIVDSALEEREQQGRPVRVGMVGAGFMARGIALQILGPVRGMELVAISNRDPERARAAWASSVSAPRRVCMACLITRANPSRRWSRLATSAWMM